MVPGARDIVVTLWLCVEIMMHCKSNTLILMLANVYRVSDLHIHIYLNNLVFLMRCTDVRRPVFVASSLTK